MGEPANDRNTDAQDDTTGNTPLAQPAADVNWAERLIRAFQVAMTDERIPEPVIRCVINRVVYGDPCGPHCRRQVERPREVPLEIHVHVDGPGPAAAAQALEISRRAAAQVRQLRIR